MITKRRIIVSMAVAILVYIGAYGLLRSYCEQYAPYAWNRGYNTVNPTPSTIHYPVFSTRRASGFSMAGIDVEYLRPLAYYVFCPLVELDLTVNNHPANPLPEWEFFGNNWP